MPDCDYHLELSDFYKPIDELIERAENNYKTRQNQKRLEVDQAELDISLNQLAPLCRVTLQDSLIAGNCRAGTLDFAAKYGIVDPDIYSGVPADKLLIMGGRAAVAAKAAIMRQSEICI